MDEVSKLSLSNSDITLRIAGSADSIRTSTQASRACTVTFRASIQRHGKRSIASSWDTLMTLESKAASRYELTALWSLPTSMSPLIRHCCGIVFVFSRDNSRNPQSSSVCSNRTILSVPSEELGRSETPNARLSESRSIESLSRLRRRPSTMLAAVFTH
jgi:hypothetical protein